VFARLAGSQFRQRFHLGDRERRYLEERDYRQFWNMRVGSSTHALRRSTRCGTANRLRTAAIQCSSRSTLPPAVVGDAWRSGTASHGDTGSARPSASMSSLDWSAGYGKR
jgi:hypothetical protein